MDKKHNAFSLIEALIILLIISVTIAGATPLITKKISLPKWSVVRDKTNNSVAISYGANNYDRVGIGSSINPYQTTPTDTQGKLVTNDMIITNSNPSDYTSVFFGSLKQGAAGNANYFPHSNSILIDTGVSGNAYWGNALDHAVVLNAYSSTAPGNCSNQLYMLTHGEGSPKSYVRATPNAAGTDKLDISTNGGSTRILLNRNNLSITVNGSNVLELQSDATAKTTLLTGILQARYLILASGSHLLNPSEAEISISADSTDKAPECGNFVRHIDFASATRYCDSTKSEPNANDGKLWFSSDKRLKAIKANYTKGIKELSKLNTYYYTFKNDEKQTLYTGLIAQHLKGLFDIALRKNEDGYYAYEKNAILYAMINSVKSINKKQNDIAQAQKDMNAEADKLIGAYK